MRKCESNINIDLDSIPLGCYLEYHWGQLIVLRAAEDKFLGLVDADGMEGTLTWNDLLRICTPDRWFERYKKHPREYFSSERRKKEEEKEKLIEQYKRLYQSLKNV